ncbi:GPP34 family phosphoprotein [Streptomyces sp. SID3343]|uniref:GOLPH3/VPS74 family protein n=1 Tax=Streptomyces sp. SID3343 TaxID=2690260 RepID=UPI001371B193|nr:GPP34 family phosphoprotein [Streptomyces sp. SID3343]MYV99901.1 hypothetical protein [Streptomyces sp. SID3343]
MGSVGEDLLLIAIGPRLGRIRHPDRIRFALQGAELLELAHAGKVVVAPGRARITRTGATPTGDRRLDQALNRLGQSVSPPTLRSWLRATPRGFVNEYVSRLEQGKALRVDRAAGGSGSTVLRISRVDVARRSAIRKRVEVVVAGAADPDPADSMLVALIHACGIQGRLFPGPTGLLARRRLAAHVLGPPPSTTERPASKPHLELQELTARLTAELRTPGSGPARDPHETLDYAPGRFENHGQDLGGGF